MKKNTSSMTRRGFLAGSVRQAAAVSAVGLLSSCEKKPAASDRPAMPKRLLGKTGMEVSVLAFGGGSQFLKNEDGAWEPMLQRAIDLGINYFDTSSGYQWGASMTSEQRFGEILRAYRDQIILSSKFQARDVDACLKEIETSLKHLRTDYLDVLMVHSVEPTEDIAAFEKGMYKEMRRLKEEKVARFIGFSSMNSSEKSKQLMEVLDVDAAILAMNPTKYGDFAEVALPVARQKNVGVIAMKVMRDLVGKNATPEELMTYALGQPGVASAVIGHVGMETLEQNAALACKIASAPMTAADRRSLETRLAHLAGPHALCWARHDYYDGKIC